MKAWIERHHGELTISTQRKNLPTLSHIAITRGLTMKMGLQRVTNEKVVGSSMDRERRPLVDRMRGWRSDKSRTEILPRKKKEKENLGPRHGLLDGGKKTRR